MRRTLILALGAAAGGTVLAGLVSGLAVLAYLWYLNLLWGSLVAGVLGLAALSWLSRRQPAELDLEDIRAWKVANVDAGGVFHGVVRGTYAADDMSVCGRTKGAHPAPQLRCTCGFYAFKSRSKALEMWEDTLATALLEVDLYGTIVEHERGFRAQSQVVLALHLPTRCRHCLRVADGVSVGADGYYEVACSRCRDRRGGITSEELAVLVGTEVQHTLRWNLLPRKGKQQDS